jgi:hypothetical protein
MMMKNPPFPTYISDYQGRVCGGSRRVYRIGYQGRVVVEVEGFIGLGYQGRVCGGSRRVYIGYQGRTLVTQFG